MLDAVRIQDFCETTADCIRIQVGRLLHAAADMVDGGCGADEIYHREKRRIAALLEEVRQRDL